MIGLLEEVAKVFVMIVSRILAIDLEADWRERPSGKNRRQLVVVVFAVWIGGRGEPLLENPLEWQAELGVCESFRRPRRMKETRDANLQTRKTSRHEYPHRAGRESHGIL